MISFVLIFIIYLTLIIICNVFFEDTNIISTSISLITLIILCILYLYNYFKNKNKTKMINI